jgi:hypothetical protein
MNWIFLNKNNSDEYIEMFARGCSAVPTELETWRYQDSDAPLVIRGIMKHKIIKQCWADSRPFWYMDSGYVGNRPSVLNPHGWKQWHRVVPNNLQHGAVTPRPADRWQRHDIAMPQRRHGSKILLAAPDEKPCVFYDITLADWIAQTVATIQQYTDREIVIRERNPNRQARVASDLQSALTDVHAVVTFNSIAATESVLAGVPAFALAPSNAAIPVANTDLSKINNPWYPDQDQIHDWACHLAYGQFHNSELRDGTAHRILQQTEEMLNA